MVSKKFWLGLLCIVVLVGAVGGTLIGTFIGNRISSLESRVDSLQENISSLEDESDSLLNNVSTLQSQIDELQGEINRLQNELAHINKTRTFIFEFLPWCQSIVSGPLRMELTFTLQEGNLSILAKINDDDYDSGEFGGDYLGLVFDRNSNGDLEDVGIMLYPVNTKLPGLLRGDGMLWCPFIMVPSASPYHTCTYETGMGYTFNASFSISELGTPSDLIHVCFYDVAVGEGVYVCFRFGIEVS